MYNCSYHNLHNAGPEKSSSYKIPRGKSLFAPDPMDSDLGDDRTWKFDAKNKVYVQKYLNTDKLLSNNVDKLSEAMEKLILHSSTSSTWKKHNSAWNSFDSFCKSTKTEFAMPIPVEKMRSYVTWAVTSKKLKPSTVESYISSLCTAHCLAGIECSSFMKDRCIQLLLKGAENVNMLENPSSKTRLAMNIHLLEFLGHQINKSKWDTLSKQIIWTASTMSFYTSCRMGEIVSSNRKNFDPKTTVLWENVIFSEEGEATVYVPFTKTTGLKGTVLDIFPTKNSTCPYAALNTLRKMSLEYEIFDMKKPIFQFKTGFYLTVEKMNEIIGSMLRQFTDDKNTLSCHSFRAAIPSAIASHPNKVTVAEVKEWGHWHSDSFRRYTRQEKEKNRKIFYKAVGLL